MTLQPLWRKVSTDKKARCEDGDAWEMLKQRVVDQIADTAQNFINTELVDKSNDEIERIKIPGVGFVKGAGTLFEDPGEFFEDMGQGFLKAFSSPQNFLDAFPFSIGNLFGRRLYHDDRKVDPDSLLGRPIPRVCFENSWHPYKCDHILMTDKMRDSLAACEDSQYGLENMCYYARVQEICIHSEKLNEYVELFSQGTKTIDVVQKEFADAFGDSFEYIDPVRMHIEPTHSSIHTSTSLFPPILFYFNGPTIHTHSVCDLPLSLRR